MTTFAVMDLHLLEQVLSSSPHPHLFDDLLVQTSSCVLQFAASSLGKRVATLLKKDKWKIELSIRDTFACRQDLQQYIVSVPILGLSTLLIIYVPISK